VKPSCLRFRNAWISDRTLCYLATGRPAVVEDTGPSAYLPNGEGLLRFTSLEQAVDAVRRVDADYARHCRAARAIVEAHFDAKTVVANVLDQALC
jgi:glycosyltransferase involved in cell wall biosynthesis